MPIGYPFNAQASIGVSFNASVATGAMVASSQSFNTIPLPNTQLALYRLSIRAPGGSNQSVRDWTFPISPQNLQKSFTAMANVYDVAGPSKTSGVMRVVDMYGNSPVTYKLRGTTGWQRHSTDNYESTGLESIADIQDCLNSFASFNAGQQADNNSDLYTLEFYDYFTGDFWQVVPIGPQTVMQDAQRPLLFYYDFTLAGVKNLTDPITDSTDDPVQSALSVSTSQAVSTLNTSLTSTLNSYVGETAGALGILNT